MMIDTTRMSSRSHQLMGVRRSREVSQIIKKGLGLRAKGLGLGQALGEPSALSSQPLFTYLLGHSHHLDHLLDRMHADDVRAAENGGGHGGPCSPVPPPRGAPPHRVAPEPLSRG